LLGGAWGAADAGGLEVLLALGLEVADDRDDGCGCYGEVT
jgi:hypothetical protein